MKGTLCVYYSRTNITASLAEYIKKELNCELLNITDGKSREGFNGIIESLQDTFNKNKEIKLNSFGTGKKIEDYRNIIICTPIWGFKICPIVKTFLKKYGKKFKGNVYFITTHAFKFSYDKKVNHLDQYLNVKHVSHLSLYNKDDNQIKLVNTFIKCIK